MSSRNRILSDHLFSPLFTVRAYLYQFGVLFGLVITLSGAGHTWLMPLAVSAAVVAWRQRRSCSVPHAWALDMAFSVGLATLVQSPITIATVVGWCAIVGLSDAQHRWIFPTVGGIAGAATTAAVVAGAPLSFGLSTSDIVAVVNVAMIAVFFVFVFRMVGDLLRQNEQELRQNEQELRQFFDRVPVALCRTTVDGNLLEHNRAAATMFGSLAEAGKVGARYLEPADRDGFVRALINDGVVHNHETPLRVNSDKTIDAVISANAVEDENGALRFIESAIFDFTPLKTMQLERERLARVVDSTSDLVAISDWDGSIRYANPAAREWMRLYVTDDDYTHMSQPVTPIDLAMMKEALIAHGTWSGELTIAGREGPRTVGVSLQGLDMGGTTGFAAIARDVTDEIATARQLRRLLKAKDEFVASVSHEIRTPLSVVVGLAAELRDGAFDQATQRELATLISDQAQEIAYIVEDLLVAARSDTGSIVLVAERVDLGVETDTTLRVLPQSPGDSRIEALVDGVCWGDAGRIRQILRNLLTNARRYGGNHIVVSSRRTGGIVCIDVADDGPGVPEHQVDVIFLPFERAHAAGTQPGSIGLGLSVSRDLARRMGGDLTYIRHGGRTVFTLALPNSPAPLPV